MSGPLDDKNFVNTIIEAINQRKLVLFVGAGVSKLCGLPLWYDLGCSLIDTCVYTQECNFSSKDKKLLLDRIKDSRELVTIASNMLEEAKGRDFFLSELNRLLTINENKLSEIEIKNYNEIPNLLIGLSDCILTTNADRILDAAFPGKKSVFFDLTKTSKAKLENTTHKLIHIHGSLEKPETLVFKTTDYLLKYQDPTFKRLMVDYFFDNPEFVTIFIGYSLSELQLLDFIVNGDTTKIKKRKNRVFLLNGYYSYEQCVINAERNYYSKMGITLVPFEFDKNEYQELVNVLSELKCEADAISNKTIYSIKDTIILFAKAPSKSSFDVLKNSYHRLNESQRNFLFDEMNKSPFKDKWVKKIIQDDYFKKKINKIDMSKPITAIHFFLLNFVTNNSYILEYVRDEVAIKFIECFDKEKTIAFDDNKYRCLCRKIASDNELLACNKTLSFYKRIAKEDLEGYWMLYIFNYKNVFNKLNKKILSEYLIVMLKHIYDFNDKHYQFDDLYEMFDDDILSKTATKLYASCFKLIRNKITKNYKNSLWDLDCFKIIFSTENYYDPFLKILRVILKCLPFVDESNILKQFKSLYSKNNIFYKCFSIYIVNIRFSTLRDKICLIFNDSRNRYIFAELYCFVENHVNEFTDEEFTHIVNYIRHISFENYSEIWDVTAQHYMISLILDSKFSLRSEPLYELFNSINSKIDTRYKESFKTMPDPYNISKSIWSAHLVDSDSKIELNRIKEMSDDEFVKYLKNINDNDFYPLAIIDHLKSRIVDDVFLEKIIKESTTIPFKIIQIIIEQICFSKIIAKDALKAVFGIVSNRKHDKNSLKMIASKNLYYLVSNNSDQFIKDKVLSAKVFDFVFDNKILYKCNEVIDDNINSLFNTDFFQITSLLLMTCDKEKWSLLKPLLKEMFNSTNNLNSSIVKASIVAHIGFVWNIDKHFCKEEIVNLFDNYLNKQNQSYSAFVLSMYYYNEFVNLLYEKGIVVDLLNSKEFSRAWNYIYLLICSYVYGEIKIDIISQILNTKDANHGFNYFIVNQGRNGFGDDERIKIETLFGLIAQNGINDSGHCAKTLIERNKELYFINNYYECVLKLIETKNSPTDAKDYFEILKESNFKQNEIEEIVYTYLSNLDYYLYFYDEITLLFKSVNWSSQEKRTKLINILGSKNPKFYSL